MKFLEYLDAFCDLKSVLMGFKLIDWACNKQNFYSCKPSRDVKGAKICSSEKILNRQIFYGTLKQVKKKGLLGSSAHLQFWQYLDDKNTFCRNIAVAFHNLFKPQASNLDIKFSCPYTWNVQKYPKFSFQFAHLGMKNYQIIFSSKYLFI